VLRFTGDRRGAEGGGVVSRGDYCLAIGGKNRL
jgi:hypothetical protein